MKSKVEKELNKKNKIFDFKGLFKNFVAGQVELSQEQVIMNDPDLTQQQKELLIECLNKQKDEADVLNIYETVHSEERKKIGSVKINRISKRKDVEEENKKDKNIDDDFVK